VQIIEHIGLQSEPLPIKILEAFPVPPLASLQSESAVGKTSL